jgi:hypothetical protein
VKLYVTYRWCQGIEQQFLALQKGFHEVIPQHHLRPFDERELELVIGKDPCNVVRLQLNSAVWFLQVELEKLILSTGNLTPDSSIAMSKPPLSSGSG